MAFAIDALFPVATRLGLRKEIDDTEFTSRLKGHLFGMSGSYAAAYSQKTLVNNAKRMEA